MQGAKAAPTRAKAQSALLSADSLNLNYGALKALRGAGISVLEGEITALIGLNGAGKTSLLNALMGAIPLTSGKITFCGENIERLDTLERVRRGLTLCPEGRQVFARMSVQENLRMGGYLLPRSQVNARAGELLDIFPRLKARLSQQAGTLSGGEQQWLAIARALMSKPRLLLMDEPTLGLAPEAVSELFALLKRISATGVTLLIVEQDVKGVLSIANDVYALKSGESLYLGRADALLDDALFNVEWLAQQV